MLIVSLCVSCFQVSKTNPLADNPFRIPHFITFQTDILPQVREALLTKFHFFYDKYPKQNQHLRTVAKSRATSDSKKSSLARSLEACGKSSGASSVKSHLSQSLAQHRKTKAGNSPASTSGVTSAGHDEKSNVISTGNASRCTMRDRGGSVATVGNLSPRSDAAAVARRSSLSLSPTRSKSDFDVLKGGRESAPKKRGSVESQDTQSSSKKRGSRESHGSHLSFTPSGLSVSLAQFASKVTNVDFGFSRGSVSGGDTKSQSTSPLVKRKKNVTHSGALGVLQRALGGSSGNTGSAAEHHQDRVGAQSGTDGALATSHDSSTKVTPPHRAQFTLPYTHTEPLGPSASPTETPEQSPMKRTAASVVGKLLRSQPHTKRHQASVSSASAVAKRLSPSKRKRPTTSFTEAVFSAVSPSKQRRDATTSRASLRESRTPEKPMQDAQESIHADTVPNNTLRTSSVFIPPKSKAVRRSLFSTSGQEHIEATQAISLAERIDVRSSIDKNTSDLDELDQTDMSVDAALQADRDSAPVDDNFREFFLHTSGCAQVIMKKDTLLWVSTSLQMC